LNRNGLSMNRNPDPVAAQAGTGRLAKPSIAQLVGQVYEAAPLVERGRLIQHLLQPLGVLSLVAIADGVFAKIRFRSGWQTMQVRLEDTLDVRASHVMALADHAQQVSVETVDALAQMLSGSPVLAGTAAAGLLVTLLRQRTARRQPDPAAGADP
jgi:hypothetical protein